jgi:hypothetical protein
MHEEYDIYKGAEVQLEGVHVCCQRDTENIIYAKNVEKNGILKIVNNENVDKYHNVKEITMSAENVADMERIVDEIDVVLKKSGLGTDKYRLNDECGISLTIIPLILRKPKRQRYRSFYVSWVQDVLSFDANKTICEFNNKLMYRPKDSRYVKGSPKNGDDEYVGIYFEDPVVH